MVHEQGDIVDSIESNIEAASVQVHQGTDQLRQVRFFELCFLLLSKLHCDVVAVGQTIRSASRKLSTVIRLTD